MKTRLFAVLFLLLAATPAQAQNLDFAPEGAVRMEWLYSFRSSNQVYSGAGNVYTLLQSLQDKYLLPYSSITGSLEERHQAHYLRFAYGLSNQWNLVGQVSKERRSRWGNLQEVTAGSLAQMAGDGPQEIQGMGDALLGFAWRPMYESNHDFKLHLMAKSDTGATAYHLNRNLHLGTGTVGFQGRAEWDYYLDRFPWVVRASLYGGTDVVNSRNTNSLGQNVRLQNGNNRTSTLYLEIPQSRLSYAIGFERFEHGNSMYNSVQVQDDWVLNQVGIKVFKNNLHKLDKGPISFPWQFSLEYTHPVSGHGTMAAGRTQTNFVFFL